MQFFTNKQTHTPSIGIRLLKALLVLLLSLGGLFLISRIFPLPRGMGLQYVAHPLYALGGIVLATVGYLITAFVKPVNETKAFWISLTASLGFSLLIFTSA
ncbi:MAG: hypothetical protein AAF587_11540 [Bacteroidota bacterium]